MKILVTGRGGQVARALAERGSMRGSEIDLKFVQRPRLDLADPESIARVIGEVQPELIVSAAAYTAVDKAEDEPELAMAVNGEAPGHIGRAAAQVGAGVLHLSTDYVFDGSGEEPWTESDRTGPLGLYGRSKLAGEQALAASGARHAIIRTAWVYSPFGANFVKTMLRLAEERDELTIVADQYGNPTSAHDIADALLAVVGSWADDPQPGASPVYHFGGTGSTNWADFARAIFAESEKHGGPTARVRDIPSSEFPTRATRPANSRLDSSLFAETFGYRSPRWRDSLASVVDRLVGS